jgi:ABC-type spermidine/putrescine transport system permease subunit I
MARPFWMIAIFGILVGVIIVIYMQPITGHLKIQSERNAFQHLVKTISHSVYLKAFLATTLLATVVLCLCLLERIQYS